MVKTALKLLLVFVEYSESNAALLIQAIASVDTKGGQNAERCSDVDSGSVGNGFALFPCEFQLNLGCKPWSNAMEILHEKDGVDTELLVYAMTLINKVSQRRP